MDKETIALIIAQNGLGTAVTLLTAKASKLTKKAAAAADPAVKEKLTADARKAEKLAGALKIANSGVNEYIAEFTS